MPRLRVEKITEGDLVLVFLSRDKTWLTKVTSGNLLHTHVGILDIGSLLGKQFGSKLKSTLGEEVWALKPIIHDLILKSERKTQIAYPKDMGLIALKTGLCPGLKVVEAGAGSGAMTMFLANIVRPEGHVYSYDIRPEFLSIVKRNLDKAGLSEYVTLKNADATEGLDVKSADIAIIDVGDPWSLVSPMKDALKGGGRVAALTPTVNQLEKLVVELARNNFKLIESMEVMVRGIEARPNKTRPEMRMIGHTAYITTARKASP